jgi:hypothetical protein
MKITKEYALRIIAGNFIVVPNGGKTVSFDSMITMNETGGFLWQQLEEDRTEEELTQALLREYDIDDETAAEDVENFIVKLKNKGIIS